MKDIRLCKRSHRAQCCTVCIGPEKKEIPHRSPLIS
uniref:Uncharacterized protein n=1 Tax=Arundo donax TaxID=35708 RepID=A0A0A8Y7Q7_ARUDO